MKKTLFLLAITAMISCGRFANQGSNGGDVRIVSLSKHLTEMLFALGKGKDIVAVDLGSTYPDSAKMLTTVGYHRSLSAESIIAAKPNLVIHSNDIGPDNVQKQITDAGVNVKAFAGASTIDSAHMLLKELGTFFKLEAKADAVAKKMDDGIKAAMDSVAQLKLKDTPSVMIIHFGRANSMYYVMSGRKGAGDKMILLAGGKLAAYDTKGPRQINADALAAADPDIIIATDFGFDQMGTMDKFIESVPGVSRTKAARNRRIVRFEEHDLVYFGPRSGENILKLTKVIHEMGGVERK